MPRQEPAVSWRGLVPEDVDRVYALHRSATEAVGRPDLIRPESRDFFEAILSGGGSIIGAHDPLGLLAYGVLQWDLPPAEDLRGLLGLPAGAPFAKLAGASVRPGAWGGGLHEALIARRVAEAARRDLTELYSTAAPGNTRSWTNLLNQGFAVRVVIEQYGGHLRYIVHRGALEPAANATDDGSEAIWCAAGETGRERALVAEGRVGSCWRPGSDGVKEIGWTRPR